MRPTEQCALRMRAPARASLRPMTRGTMHRLPGAGGGGGGSGGGGGGGGAGGGAGGGGGDAGAREVGRAPLEDERAVRRRPGRRLEHAVSRTNISPEVALVGQQRAAKAFDREVQARLGPAVRRRRGELDVSVRADVDR